MSTASRSHLASVLRPVTTERKRHPGSGRPGAPGPADARRETDSQWDQPQGDRPRNCSLQASDA